MALTRTKEKCNMTAEVTTIWHYTYLIIIIIITRRHISNTYKVKTAL